MRLEIVALVLCVLASIPAVNTTWNLLLYRPTPKRARRGAKTGSHRVSVLIPARNEEDSIRAAVAGALSDTAAELEVLVMDDHSTDGTAGIVREMAAQDPRVRLVEAPRLPAGWNGKQHACFRLAQQASGDFLVFVDADVVLGPGAIDRMVAFMQERGVDLASGIPRQRTSTLAEILVIPLIHFVLLGFLPMAGMRRWQSAAFAAGCGQLFIGRRPAYFDCGGHRGIRASRHDGLMLPRLFRRAGKPTDLFDATDIAECRMYESGQEVWEGFAKNATEGMAKPTAILPWTVILAGGQVLSLMLPFVAIARGSQSLLGYGFLALVLVFGTRLLLAVRFRQPLLSVLLHPVGVLLVLAIQWYALAHHLAGAPLAWKGRT